ncbi:MAG: glycosyltransferase family 4 protein [Candidatus Aenigmarchaeota archaeon]|nr:glycosyltransferase family 4 protein [Candidatus Aenigmarchaeota archaeon]
MKVAILAYEFYPLNLGGLGTHLRHLSDGLKDICDLEVFLPFKMKVPGLNLIDVAIKDARKYVTKSYKLDKVIKYNKILPEKFREFPADVVHAHDWVTIDGGRRIKEEFGVPLVMTIHSSILGKKKLTGSFVREKKELEKSIYSADRYIAVSRHIKNELVELYGLDRKKIDIIYNGIEYDKFRTGPDKNYIFFLGRLDQMKGVHFLVEAYSMIKDDIPQKLLLCGTGNNEYREFIMKMISELGLKNHVTIRGRLKENELVKLYSEASIVALPSVYEPFGITVLEGMASGKAVITTTRSGASEIVDNWKNAVVVKSGDSKDLARAMKKLLLDDKLRDKISSNALKLAKLYSWDNIARETLKVYRKVA